MRSSFTILAIVRGETVHAFIKLPNGLAVLTLPLVENGQYSERWIDSHMLPEQTAAAVKAVKTARFMPVHWAEYPLALHTWDEPVNVSVPLVEQAGIQIVTPLMGEVFDKNTQTTRW